MSFADILFIILVAGVIYAFVYWVGPARSGRKQANDKDPES